MAKERYKTYYNRCVDLFFNENKMIPTREEVYGSEYYSKLEAKDLDKAIYDFCENRRIIVQRYHPTWLEAVKNGASPAECLRRWKEDDPDNTYLMEIKYIK